MNIYSGKKCLLETFTGKLVDVFNLKPDDIRIEDIAHSLAMTCRFNGHPKHFYSVAQHCVLGLRLVPDHLKLRWLLHDAAEAYMPDMPSPMKALLPEYRELENKVLGEIFSKWNLEYKPMPEIKVADNILLVTEAGSLMEDCEWDWSDWADGNKPLEMDINSWTWEKAEYEYLRHFNLLL